MCGKAFEQLKSIEDRLKDASFKSKRAVFDVVKGEVDKHLGRQVRRFVVHVLRHHRLRVGEREVP